MVTEHAAIKDITETVTAVNTNLFIENSSFFLFQIIIKDDFQENMEILNEQNKKALKIEHLFYLLFRNNFIFFYIHIIFSHKLFNLFHFSNDIF
ncbi:hypothetical protein BK728_09305 [Bacillus thuringiensis serovar chanpaisis]|nr:hypothetical protein BK728_09305 [Bacillus thuringiensis serovar chanpaisis]